MEWLNADTEWRDERPAAVGARARALSVSAGRNAGVAARSSGRDARRDGTRSRSGGRSSRSPAPTRTRARAGWTTTCEGYRRGWFLRIPVVRRVVSHVRDARCARAPARRTTPPRMRRRSSRHCRRGARVFGDRRDRIACRTRVLGEQSRATGSIREICQRHGSRAHVHRSHECANRRRDRPSKGWTHR